MDGKIKVALVAGEASGDILGGALMRELRGQHPDIEFIGVGGPRCRSRGCSHFFRWNDWL